VTLSGYNLGNASRVRIGSFNVSGFTQVSASQIKFTIPAGSVTGKISVVTPGGTAESANSFTVYAPPQIGGFSPATGNIGSQVTISGSHLASVLLVKFNTQFTTSFVSVTDNQIRLALPAGATTGPITIQTKGGTVVSTQIFTVILKPSISSFTPTSGGPGTVVTLSGNNLNNVGVAFNGVPAASVTPVSAFQLRAVVPAGSTTGPISATNTAGDTGTSAASFTVLQPPAVWNVSPGSGAPGTGVLLTGSNFNNVVSVKFNGTTASFVVNGATQITTTVPAGASNGKITVTTSGGTAASAGDFTILAGTAPPVISSFAPSSGAPGATVILNGTGFAGTTSVRFAGSDNTLIGASFRVDSAQKITSTVPANSVTGAIRVTTGGGTAISGTTYTVHKYPVIFSFSPTTGPADALVTITGANFTGTTSVKFAGANGTSIQAGFTLLSATQIRASVPLSAVTGKISVTNGFGTGQSGTDFVVAPRIDAFTPSGGPVGTVVTITGRAFSGATAVQFNGTLAEFTVVSSTQITATAPAAATTGILSVTTAGGTGSSSTPFTITP
jgi:hypothetical protein